MRFASAAGRCLLALAALSALAACGKRTALNSPITTKPNPDAAIEHIAPPAPDAAEETVVVAPKPDAAPPKPDAPAFEAAPVSEVGMSFDVGPIFEAGAPGDGGSSDCPQRDIPTGKFTFLHAGNDITCAVRDDGALKCFGSLYYPASAMPTGAFSRVGGQFSMCAVRAAGALVCWGQEFTFGEDLPPSGTFKDVGRGEDAACALRTDGAMVCWGSPNRTAFAPAGQFESMSEGAYFTCAVAATDHAAHCWDARSAVDPPKVTPGPFLQVGAGRFYACGLLTDHTVKCWSLGETVPTPAGGTFREIAVGEFWACGLLDDGTPVCWGMNTFTNLTPPAGLRFQHVSVGSSHACGILLDGTLTCWGEVRDPCSPG